MMPTQCLHHQSRQSVAIETGSSLTDAEAVMCGRLNGNDETHELLTTHLSGAQEAYFAAHRSL